MKRSVWTAALALAGLAATADAKLAWVKKAQEFDPTVKNCLACHTSAKVTAKDQQLNARGQFLADKKKELKASEVDLKWLKDYKEEK